MRLSAGYVSYKEYELPTLFCVAEPKNNLYQVPGTWYQVSVIVPGMICKVKYELDCLSHTRYDTRTIFLLAAPRVPTSMILAHCCVYSFITAVVANKSRDWPSS